MTKKIAVVGSTNTDMVIRSHKIPAPGETVLGGEFIQAAGGKGANQAVAAARLGGNVIFITRLGQDVFGDQALANFERDHIDVRGICRDPHAPSGIALIMVDQQGENLISVAPGANMQLTPPRVREIEPLLADADIILMQLEIPLATVATVVEIGKAHGALMILNPAPATPLDASWLQNVTILTPNRSELELLTGIPVTDQHTAAKAAQKLLIQGIEQVIVTLGPQGAVWVTAQQRELIPSFEVNAVDTTAAGDAFNGALAVALAENQDLKTAIRFANAVAALSVTRLGAQPSLPYRTEVDTFLHP